MVSLVRPVIFFLLVAFLCPIICIAQRDALTYFSVETGVSLGQGDDLSRVYDFGVRLSNGLTFPVLKRKLRVVLPKVSVNYYGNYYNEGIRDNLIFWNIGPSVELNRNSRKKVNLAPHVGLHYFVGKNFLVPRKGYRGDRVDLFSFRGVGGDLGVKLISNRIFLALSLQIVNPIGKIDNKIKEELKNELGVSEALYNIVEFPPSRFSFNNITLAVGYNIATQ